DRLGALRPGAGPTEQKAADVPPDQRKPSPQVVGEEMITKKGVFGIVQGHANRHLAIDPKDGALFVGVGSSGNLGVEPEVKASIQRFAADGSGQSTFASGMRNATALAFEPTGDEVVRVPFTGGRPEGGYENFVVGFWASNTRRAEVWGRPTALAVAKDGALLIADDTGGTIWRISYDGPRQCERPGATTG